MLHDRDDPEAQIDEGQVNVWERSRQSGGSDKQNNAEPKIMRHVEKMEEMTSTYECDTEP